MHFCQRAVRRIQVIQCRCILFNRFFVALYFSFLQRFNSRIDFTARIGNRVNGLCIALDRSGIRLYSPAVFRNRPGFSGQRGNRRINFAAFLGNVGNGFFIVLYIRNILRNLYPNIRLTLLQMLHSPVIHSADILHNLIHCLIYFTVFSGNVGNGLCIIFRLSFIGHNLFLQFCQRAVRRIQPVQRRNSRVNFTALLGNVGNGLCIASDRFGIRLYSSAVFRNRPGFSRQSGNRRINFTALLGNVGNGLCIIFRLSFISRNLFLHFCQRAVRRIQVIQCRCILFNRRLIRRNGAAFFRQSGNRFSIRLYSPAVFRNRPGFSRQSGNSRVDFTALLGNRVNSLGIIFRLSFIGRNLFLHFCQRAVRRIQVIQCRCILFNRRLIRRNGAAFFRQSGNRFSIRLYSPAVFRNRPGFSRQSGNSRVDFTALLGNRVNSLCIIIDIARIAGDPSRQGI